MADNRPIRDGDNVNFTGALDELADGSFSPKASLLAGDGTTTPVSPATTGGQATNTTAVNTVATNIGATNEGAAGTDTATSGLNGLFKRYLQRFTAFLALLPAALTGSGNFKVAVQESVKAATIDDLADVTLNNGSQTSLVAVDTTRHEAIIVADPANTANIRLGKTGQVGAARGALLQPGQSITLATTAAIFGFAAVAAQKVSITLLKD